MSGRKPGLWGRTVNLALLLLAPLTLPVVFWKPLELQGGGGSSLGQASLSCTTQPWRPRPSKAELACRECGVGAGGKDFRCSGGPMFAPSLCLLPLVPPSHLFRGFSCSASIQEARELTPLLCAFCDLHPQNFLIPILPQTPGMWVGHIHSPSGRGQRCPRPWSMSEKNQDLVFQW